MLPGVAVDLLVGQLDRFLHPEGEALRRGVLVGGPGGGEMAVDEVGGHGARELAGGRAAHAVGHHEERAARPDLVPAHLRMEAGVAGAEVGDEEGVLVVLAGAPQIGLAEDGHLNRRPVSAYPGARVTRAVPSDDPFGDVGV